MTTPNTEQRNDAVSELLDTALIRAVGDGLLNAAEYDEIMAAWNARAQPPAPSPLEGEGADIMIGEFIARWEDAADGVMMDADTAEALAREFKRMRGLIYCPGVLRCAKCDFRLIKTTLTPAGAFANEEPDSCPNCNVPMWKVTWQDEAKEAYKVAESHMDRALEAEAALSTEAGSGEVERLKLDLAAQECLQDGAYKAGVKLGWNLCATEDEDGYQRVTGGTEHIAELKRIREARAAIAEAGKPAGKIDPSEKS